MDDLASHSFELVNRELVSTLDGARRELEEYVDGHSGKDSLLRTAEMLHIARGALKIVEIHGAALLAEEMELTCRRLAETEDPQKSEQAPARRRQGCRARAVAAAERPAAGTRQAVAVGRHARAAEFRAVRAPHRSAVGAGSGRDRCRPRVRQGCAAFAAGVPGFAARLDQRRRLATPSRRITACQREPRARCRERAGQTTLGRFDRRADGDSGRRSRGECHVEATHRSGRPAAEAADRRRRIGARQRATCRSRQ